jgi:hypothetical protein
LLPCTLRSATGAQCGRVEIVAGGEAAAVEHELPCRAQGAVGGARGCAASGDDDVVEGGLELATRSAVVFAGDGEQLVEQRSGDVGGQATAGHDDEALLAARPTAEKMIAHGWIPDPFRLLSVLTDAG